MCGHLQRQRLGQVGIPEGVASVWVFLSFIAHFLGNCLAYYKHDLKKIVFAKRAFSYIVDNMHVHCSIYLLILKIQLFEQEVTFKSRKIEKDLNYEMQIIDYKWSFDNEWTPFTTNRNISPLPVLLPVKNTHLKLENRICRQIQDLHASFSCKRVEEPLKES